MADILSRLAPPKGARAISKKRPGRGPGSGLGTTGGRGQKGDRARGGSPRAGFEGGQMPLYRRVPKRGFVSPRGIHYNVVNLGDLARFAAGSTVDPEALRAARLVRRRGPVKVLGQGKLDRALTVKAHAFSATAEQAIAAAGGKVERLAGRGAQVVPAAPAPQEGGGAS
jgi:large subunit ribosomal protein L15